MENPWNNLPLISPYILAEDREAIAEFNSEKAAGEKYENPIGDTAGAFSGKP